MKAKEPRSLDSLIEQVASGSPNAFDQVFPLVYDQLRAIARNVIRDDSSSTLQATALVHEAWMKLSGDEKGFSWQGKAQFASLAARAMRQALVDHVRSKNRDKRQGKRHQVTLTGLLTEDASDLPVELLDLDEALKLLADRHARPAQVLEMRFFAGLDRESIAGVLGVTVRTVNTDLALAQSWLLRELSRGGA